MYFDYFLDAGGPTDFDSARVFASTDGANWTNLLANPSSSNPLVEEGNLTNTNGQWLQESVSLAAFAGQSNVRLRFDFTTAGTMNVGDGTNPTNTPSSLDTTGAYWESAVRRTTAQRRHLPGRIGPHAARRTDDLRV